MKFENTIIDLIKKRYSVRNYNGDDLDDEIKENLITVLNDVVKTPFGNKVRFKLVESDDNKNQKIGTYGTISGTKHFIAGAVENGERSLEDFGYAMECIILYATEIGLGTCWLGGSLKRSQFADLIELKEKEIIPAVTPIGYISEKGNFKDKLIQIMVKPRLRKEWNEIFFDENFSMPLEKNESDIYKYPLEMLRLAPSASNKQPWRILKKENNYHFYLERNKSYQNTLKMVGYDLQRIDMGIAMSHFELTADEINLEGEWQIKDPENVNNSSNREYIISWISGK